MKPLLFLLLTLPLSLKAQEPRGGCAVILLSDSSTLYQSWCLETPTATIDPLVWLVQGTGIQVTGLPPGVTAELSNDTMTISGTITTESVNTVHITTTNGCSSAYMSLDMSVIVDPEFTCSVAGEDVILHWPGMNAPLEWGAYFFVTCISADGFADVLPVFLPNPDSVVWSGLPTNTELTFYLGDGVGMPYCFPGVYQTVCTIVTTGVEEQADMDVRVLCVHNRLELMAPSGVREVRIHDMLGQLVMAHTVTGTTASIPIGTLAPGAFILHATGADGRVSVQRFVKQ
ncbi:MAG: T9SS type A sorting domain-containing protein [Flavobacteriales bacterium]|nr:T9SS type A sorting domain-containing protein [Flavobacteriales bacterium]